MKIFGGLGNQMFQYAAARALALRRGAAPDDLKLDTSMYEAHRMHNGFELRNVFGIDASEANSGDLYRALRWQALGPIRDLLLRPRLAGLRKRAMVVEPHFNYWAGLNEVPSDVFLSGYWQSEKYFSDFAPQIRRDFEFSEPDTVINKDLLRNIHSTHSVSVHVRRGDYVSDSAANKVHGTCTPDYYQRAIAMVDSRTSDAHFFVFSDDIAWVRSAIDFGSRATFVSHNTGSDSFRDMQLMAACRQHIVANSSFSWWGAWLDPRPDKVVMAPRTWFASEKLDTRDLVPADWIRL